MKIRTKETGKEYEVDGFGKFNTSGKVPEYYVITITRKIIDIDWDTEHTDEWEIIEDESKEQ